MKRLFVGARQSPRIGSSRYYSTSITAAITIRFARLRYRSRRTVLFVLRTRRPGGRTDCLLYIFNSGRVFGLRDIVDFETPLIVFERHAKLYPPVIRTQFSVRSAVFEHTRSRSSLAPTPHPDVLLVTVSNRSPRSGRIIIDCTRSDR